MTTYLTPAGPGRHRRGLAERARRTLDAQTVAARMNWMKKGPDLKLSELKIPDFAYDLYYDLKERHLLPSWRCSWWRWSRCRSTSRAPRPPARKRRRTAAPIATEPGASAAGGRRRGGPLGTGPARLQATAEGRAGARPVRTKGGGEQAPAVNQAPRTSGSQGSSVQSGFPVLLFILLVLSSSTAAVETSAEATVIGEEATPAAPEVAPPVEETAPVRNGAPPGRNVRRRDRIDRRRAGGGKTRTRYESYSIDVRIVSVPGEAKHAKGKAKKPRIRIRRNLPELTMLPGAGDPRGDLHGD